MKYGSNRKVWGLGLLCGFALGCSGQGNGASTGEDLDGVPELGAVQLALTESPENEGTATADDAVDPMSASGMMAMIQVPENAPEDLVGAQKGIKGLNDGLRSFLSPIVALVRDVEPTAKIGLLRVWGPYEKDGIDYRFVLRNSLSGDFAWRLDARPTESDDAYSRIAAGALVVGNEARRGAGVMGVDVDALVALVPDAKARGKILVGFTHGDRGTTVGYALDDFTGDVDENAGIDALLGGVHLADGRNRVRLAFRGDIEGSETEAEEVVLARLRHLRDEGGRSDLLILDGDIPDGQGWVRSQCWNAGLEKVFSETLLCPIESPVDLSLCEVLETEGDVTECPRATRDAELPPTDPTEPMEDPEDPNDGVVIPDSMDSIEDPGMP